MALLSQLPFSKISTSDPKDPWNRYTRDFGISTQKEMYEWSHLDDFVTAIRSLIENEKNKILFAKPLNAIMAAGDKKKFDNDNELNMINSKIELLMMPDSDIDEKEENLAKANKRLTKKINSLGEDLDADIQNLVRKGKNELEDIVDASCKRMKDIIQNEWGRMKSFESIQPHIDAEIQNMVTRKLKRATENLADDGKKKIKRSIGDFFADAEDLLMRYLPDFDSRDFVKSTQNQIQMEMESNELFTMDNSDEDEEEFSWGDLFNDVLDGFLTGYTFGGWSLAKNAYNHSEMKNKALNWVNSISVNFDSDPYLQTALKTSL